MTDGKHLTGSERCARLLLAAWNTGNLAGLETALRQASEASQAELSPCEEERMELVREIAGGIRNWMRGVREGKPSDLNVHLDLLRHLARCEGMSKTLAGARSIEGSGPRLTEAPRLEMLVSGPH